MIEKNQFQINMGDQYFGQRRAVESVEEKGQSLSDAAAESGESLISSVTYEKIDFIVLPISIIVGTFLGVLLVISVLLLALRWYWKWGTNAEYTKLPPSPVMDTQTKNSADVNNTESRTPVTAPSPTSSASSTTSTSSTILLTFPPPLAAVTVTKTVLPSPQLPPAPIALQSPKLPPETPQSAGPLTPQSPRVDWLHTLQTELQHIQPSDRGVRRRIRRTPHPIPRLWLLLTTSTATTSASRRWMCGQLAPKQPHRHALLQFLIRKNNLFPLLKLPSESPQNSPEVVTTPRDTLTIGLISPADTEMARNSPTARRARLKSISLDSESARLVEENLNVAMEELDLEPAPSPPACPKTTRNKHQLKIDIDSENLTDVDVRQPPTPKTPTLTQTRQKAVSLDSEPPGGVCKSKTQTAMTTSATASASVPTTPKRQQQQMSIHQPQRGKSRSTSDHLGSNLQRLKSVTLSVSNNNLKTLPEVMPLSDFGGTPPPPAQPPAKVRSSLLQRRGSNHSLTLNLAGSVGDLASNASLTGSMTTNAQATGKKGLLQRRGSNASLTLTIQCSDSGLSRFNSHGSLNAASQSRKGLLSVSNTSLRGSACSLARLKGTPGPTELCAGSGGGAHHHRKFLSSENLLQRATAHHQTDSLELEDAPGGLEDDDTADECAIRQITTKPLSPQSTSEDFKIYLANIQFLQNASNVLHMGDLREYHACFEGLHDAPSSWQEESEEDQMKQRRKIRQIHQEFWDLPTNHQEKPMVFGSQHKNRYKTILPNEHSRVILQPEDPESLQEPYINANYIKQTGGPDGTHNAYIATQGPMPNTIYEFWLMVMQNVRRSGECGGGACDQKIAMLTELLRVEGQSAQCTSPWNPEDAQTQADSVWLKAYLDMLEDDGGSSEERTDDKLIHRCAFVIENTGVEQKKGYSMRKLCVRHFDNDGKPIRFNVRHYWFPDWPDHRSPEDLGVVLDFALDLLASGIDSATQEVPTRAPLPVLHCSAGIGRTGCMAGILNAVRQIDSAPVNPSVDILGIVCNLRLQRGGMVQNSEQYELIYRVVCLYQKRKDSMTHRRPPQQQTGGPDGTHNAYIATQGPMPNTIYEFWLMVMQNVRRSGECGGGACDQKIAMLTEFVESGRTKCAVYFPVEVNQVLVFAHGADDVLSAHAPPPCSTSPEDAQTQADSVWLKAYLDMLEDDGGSSEERTDDKLIHRCAFVIENTGVEQKKGYSVRKLCVRHFDNDGKPIRFNVRHYWFPDWPDHRSPEDLGVVLDFALDLLASGIDSATQEVPTRAPLPVLHCSAGIGRTGCMAGILNAVRQIDSAPVNPSVDILGIVCNLRLQRGGMVQNSEQYELIYRVVCLYQKRKDSMTHRRPPQQVPFLLCDTLDI
uniref:protein-tyrosine-phosphatase n=1 Tax=Lutzomyia longipalpis TaxID=7200 RepID=A0A1B0CMH5_LUTLO